MDKPPRVIKLQNFSSLAEACARQSSVRSKTGIFRHTKSWRDESVSCGFRQPKSQIDFLGLITARRALICDARVILEQRSSDLHHLNISVPEKQSTALPFFLIPQLQPRLDPDILTDQNVSIYDRCLSFG